MILGFILSVILDVHSSCINLNNGYREVLLPFKTCKSQIIYSSISTPSVILYNKKIKKHKKLVKFIYIAGIVMHTSAAIHNYRIRK